MTLHYINKYNHKHIHTRKRRWLNAYIPSNDFFIQTIFRYTDEMGNVTDNQLRIYHSMITKSLTKNTQIIWLSFSLTILTSDCLEQPSNYPFYISVSTLYGLHHIFDNFHKIEHNWLIHLRHVLYIVPTYQRMMHML